MAILASGAMLMVTGASAGASVAPRGVTSASPLAYTALAPARIADTRCGVSPVPSFCASEALPSSNSTLSTLPGGGSINVAMPSTVPATAQAVVLNVAAVDQASSGFLTLWPAGQSMPVAANLTFGPAQSGYGVSNLVTVALGSASGTPAVSVYNGPSNGQSVDVVVDLEGFYAPLSGTAGEFTGESPARIADTRCTVSTPPSFCSSESLPAANSTVVTLGPGGTDTLTVAGVGGVPSTGAAAAIMNMAITDATAPSFLSVYPGATRPQVANLNWTQGETLSNKVLVDLGPTGQVTLYNNSGTVDIVVDVEGWFSNASAGLPGGSLFTPVSPTRLVDTRCGASPAPSFCSSEALPSANAALSHLSGGQSLTAAVNGVDSVPASATAAVFNVADVQPQTGNFLTVYPGGGSAPVAADLNYVPGDPYNVVTNAAYAALGSGGQSAVLNGPSDAGLTDVVVDLFGYFTPASATTASLLSNPTALLADGTSTSTVTTTLSALGLGIPGIPVSLSEVPSVAGACGTLAPMSGVTNAAGQFVSTYTASTVAGTCTITSSLDGLTPSVPINQTSNPTATLGSTLGSLPADGTSTSTVTTTLSALGLGIPGIPVSLSEVPSVAGACGTLAPTSGVTNAAGQFVSTYTASTVAGTCTITSSLDGLTSSVPISQTSTSGVTATLGSTLSSLTANGVGTSTITTTLTSLGAGVPGVPVSLSEVPSVAGACGTFAPASGVTNAAGQFVSTYTASTVPGTCTITSSVDGLTPSLPVTQTVTGLVTSVGALLTTLVANGTSTTTITTTLSSLGAGVPGVPVSLTELPSLPGSCGTVVPASGVTNSLGQLVSTYTASAVPGTCTITSSIDGLLNSVTIVQL